MDSKIKLISKMNCELRLNTEVKMLKYYGGVPNSLKKTQLLLIEYLTNIWFHTLINK